VHDLHSFPTRRSSDLGETSKDYSAIYNRSPLDSLIFHGALQPTHFGVWRNTVDYRNFTLSFSISYKFGAYFRQPSVSYGQYPIRSEEHTSELQSRENL